MKKNWISLIHHKEETILVVNIKGSEALPFKKLDCAANTTGKGDFWVLGFLNLTFEEKDCFFNLKMELEERNWEWVRDGVLYNLSLWEVTEHKL